MRNLEIRLAWDEAGTVTPDLEGEYTVCKEGGVQDLHAHVEVPVGSTEGLWQQCLSGSVRIPSAGGRARCERCGGDEFGGWSSSPRAPSSLHYSINTANIVPRLSVPDMFSRGPSCTLV